MKNELYNNSDEQMNQNEQMNQDVAVDSENQNNADSVGNKSASEIEGDVGEQETYSFVKETVKEKKRIFKRNAIQMLIHATVMTIVCLFVCYLYIRLDQPVVLPIHENDEPPVFNQTIKESENPSETEEPTTVDEEAIVRNQIMDSVITLKNYNEPIENETEDTSEKETTNEKSSDEEITKKENASEDKDGNDEVGKTEEKAGLDKKDKMYSESESSDEETKKISRLTYDKKQDDKSELKKIDETEMTKYTGVVISKNTNVTIITAESNVEDGIQIYAEVSDGKKIKELPVRVLMKDYELGIAFLSIDSKDLDNVLLSNIHPVKIADESNVQMGEDCIYGGFVKDVGFTVISGKILSQGQATYGLDLQYTTYMIYLNIIGPQTGFVPEGDGYIFTMDGKFAGICLDNAGGGSARPFIDMAEISSMIENIAKTGYASYFGIKAQGVTAEIEKLVGKELPQGLYVTYVENGSPAFQAGISVGDIIYKVDGNYVDDMNQIRKMMDAHAIGDALEVEIFRYIGDKFNPYEGSAKLAIRNK